MRRKLEGGNPNRAWLLLQCAVVSCWRDIRIAEYDAAAPFTDQDVLSQSSGLDTQGISALLFLKQAPYIITDNKHATEVICKAVG
jgi:hypothetical protein